MRISLFAITLLFLCSCSNVPKPTSYWVTHQQKMQAAHHWDVLAEDVAKDVKLALQDPDALPGEQIYLGPIYLEQNKASLFGKVFGTLLTTQLFKQRIGLAKNESDSLKLTYETQMVKHESNRYTSPFYPGTILSLTALGSGVYKAIVDNNWALGAFATAGALEVINDIEHDWNFTVPHYEIVITTELTKPNNDDVNNDDVIYRRSNIYYIKDADSWHYNDADSWHYSEKELPIKKYSCVSE